MRPAVDAAEGGMKIIIDESSCYNHSDLIDLVNDPC